MPIILTATKIEADPLSLLPDGRRAVFPDVCRAARAASDAWTAEGRIVTLIRFNRKPYRPTGARYVVARTNREVFPGYPRAGWLEKKPGQVGAPAWCYARLKAPIKAGRFILGGKWGNLTVRAPGWNGMRFN